jgi:serine/threonine protein kinase
VTGQTFSHYRVLEKLGAGGMGVVYKAQDLKLDRLVALKFLPPHLSADPQQKQHFIQEAKAACALDHPNVGVVHDIDEGADGQMFIVMAYYEGETLARRIERGVSTREAIGVAIQILDALQAAHERGIVHRDIKPGNVLLTPDGVRMRRRATMMRRRATMSFCSSLGSVRRSRAQAAISPLSGVPAQTPSWTLSSAAGAPSCSRCTRAVLSARCRFRKQCWRVAKDSFNGRKTCIGPSTIWPRGATWTSPI